MPELVQTLNNENTRKSVIQDCCSLIDEEMAAKKGLSGIALKAGYKTVKGIKPDLVPHAVSELLPEFATALDPLYQDARSGGKSSESFLVENASRAADALLAITDRRAERVDAGIIKTTYQKLRPAAKKHVEAALPRVGRMVDKYT